MSAVLYTQRMVREQGFQLQGFNSLQNAANWGLDAKDVTPLSNNARQERESAERERLRIDRLREEGEHEQREEQQHSARSF